MGDDFRHFAAEPSLCTGDHDRFVLRSMACFYLMMTPAPELQRRCGTLDLTLVDLRPTFATETLLEASFRSNKRRLVPVKRSALPAYRTAPALDVISALLMEYGVKAKMSGMLDVMTAGLVR